MLSVAYDQLTANHNLGNVRGGRRVRDLIGAGSSGAHGVRSNYNEIGKSPIGDSTAIGPAQAAVPGLAADHDQLGRREAAAFPGDEPLMHLKSTQLLERVDHCLLIRSDGQPTACVDETAGWADAIGKITLCRGTEARGRLGAAQRLDIGLGEVSGVHRRSLRAEQTMITKQLGRSATIKSPGSGVFGWLLAEMDMQRPISCRFTDGAESLRGHRSNRMHRAPNVRLIKITEQTHPGPPVINIAVGETCLDGIQWQMAGGIEPASEVTHVD